MKPGDKIRVKTKEETFEGILMPRPKLTDDQHIVLKLESGYNIGIKKNEIKTTELVEKQPGPKKSKKTVERHNPDKPTILILSTGGTISSKIDYRTGGVYASYTASELLEAAPELREIANIESKFLMNVMSEDMNPKIWVKIAREVAKEIPRVDGVVVTHGTDTMHYSTAALSFLLPNLPKPVVFTGSQRSSDRGSSDSFLNLICSTIFATQDISGVYLVMHGSMSDNYCFAHKGTKVRKMHTSRRDAFKSISEKPVAIIRADGSVDYLTDHSERTNQDLKPVLKLEEKVAMIKAYPGMDPKIVDFYIDRGYKGIVFEGTALGHLPTTLKETSLIPKIERAASEGVVMVMTTQCLYGRVHPFVYTNLREVSSRGVIYCEDMLTETAYAKLMWVLGQTKDSKKVKKLMLTNLSGEITERTTGEQDFIK